MSVEPPAAKGTITRVEVDTSFFRGNYPEQAIEQKLGNPTHHIHGGNVPAGELPGLVRLARVQGERSAAALARRESRGAHFREDFAETSAAFQHSLVYCQTTAKAVVTAC